MIRLLAFGSLLVLPAASAAEQSPPIAEEIAEAYGSLERSPVQDAARLGATGELIDRLDAAFTRYAANLQEADLDKLDIELKLLKSSLDEDLGPTPSGAPVAGKKGIV